jgi:peptide-methionine (S)-S-oxide reductase
MNGPARETTILGGGCFWCIEAALEQLRGVLAVQSGYAGGSTTHPTYDQVCSGRTGHAEVVRVTFDPSEISFRDLLDVFFTVHDPTTLNRQGADVGTQYRSVIFYEGEAQRATALEAIREVNESGIWGGDAVTEVKPAPLFFPAEDYHQTYYRRHQGQPYCQAVIAPKLAKLRKAHFDRLRKDSPVERSRDNQVLPYQTAEHNPIDHGGIED